MTFSERGGLSEKPPFMSEEETYKLYVMGSGGVGKSALTVRLVQDRFSTSYDPTIEDSYVKIINVDGKSAKLEIIDTAGQDDFEAIRETYMRAGDGFVIVFSLTDSSSFDAIDNFQKDIRTTSDNDKIPIVACGNKCDLKDERAVTEQEAKDYFKSVNIPYFETSASSNINVEASFQEITRIMRRAQHPDQEEGGLSTTPPPKTEKADNKDNTKTEGGCCNIQ